MKQFSLLITSAILISACASVQVSKVEKEGRSKIFEQCVYMSKGVSIDKAHALCSLSTGDYLNSVSSLFERKKSKIKMDCLNDKSTDVMKCMENAERKHWAIYEFKYLEHTYKNKSNNK